ncbi:sensor histidine kinase [Nocardioides sp.]|uniref:sensor histidine kinase n=1 Tax=Nocardioides sp. TaxID=35761 RepID=UPI002ED87C3D
MTPRRWVVAGCWVFAVGSFALLPLVSTGSDAERVPDLAEAAWWVGAGLVTLQAAFVLRWWSEPQAALLMAAPVAVLAGGVTLGDATNVTGFFVMVAAYLVAVARPVRQTWPALVSAGVLVACGGYFAGLRLDDPALTSIGGSVLQATGTVGAPVLVGVLVATRRESRAAREDQQRALLRERDALLTAAVARERTAMARELHDIAAHHLSGIAVMSAAIGSQIDADPEGAKEAAAQVRRQSVSVLHDLRSLVGLLRVGDEAPESGTTPTRIENLAGIGPLVEDVSRAAPVELTVLEASGRPLGEGIGPLAQLAAYRMVQESLANAARHAPGARCAVVVDDRDAASLVVTVRNGPPTRPPDVAVGSSGFGLVGMRERAELTGARLEHGPTAEGGWLVLLRVPRELDDEGES